MYLTGIKYKPQIFAVKQSKMCSLIFTVEYRDLVGTPYYLAPESATRKSVRTGKILKASDVWAVGVIAYIMLIGTTTYRFWVSNFIFHWNEIPFEFSRSIMISFFEWRIDWGMPPFRGRTQHQIMRSILSDRLAFPSDKFVSPGFIDFTRKVTTFLRCFIMIMFKFSTIAGSQDLCKIFQDVPKLIFFWKVVAKCRYIAFSCKKYLRKIIIDFLAIKTFWRPYMAQHYFSKDVSRKCYFSVKRENIFQKITLCHIWSPKILLTARKSIIIFPNYFLQENALYLHFATTFQKKKSLFKFCRSIKGSFWAASEEFGQAP